MQALRLNLIRPLSNRGRRSLSRRTDLSRFYSKPFSHQLRYKQYNYLVILIFKKLLSTILNF